MNERGQEFGNEVTTDGVDLPWLQDVDSDGDGRSDVWANSWPFEWRDVVIVDRDNTVIETYNLTNNNLADALLSMGRPAEAVPHARRPVLPARQRRLL